MHLFQQQCDLLVRIDDGADGYIVVDGCDEVCNILGYVNLVEPGTSQKLRTAIGQIGAKHTVNIPILIRLVKLFKSG